MTPFEFAALAAAGGSVASGVIGYVIGRGRPLIETQLVTIRDGRAFRQGGVLFDPATTREERLQMLDAIRDRVAMGLDGFGGSAEPGPNEVRDEAGQNASRDAGDELTRGQ